MNYSPFWPLVWKEYRAGRAFWVAMAAMGLVAQGGVAWLTHRQNDRDWWLYGIALMISAGFAVGIGGMLFAIEQEERTIALLRTLPLRARELGSAKIITALLGLAALLGILWLAANIMADWRKLPVREASQLWNTWGLACLEGLAWGAFYSLVLRQPLWATVAAAATVALIDTTGATIVTRNSSALVSYAETVPYRTGLLLLVALADAMLLPRWLAGAGPRRSRWRQTVRRFLPRRAPAWGPSLTRLIWQSAREGWVSFLLLVIIAPVAFALLRVPSPSVGNWLWNMTLLLASPIPLASIVALNGALVFRADQLHGPRFLAAQGVSPRTIWFARQWAWGFWLWLMMAALVGLVFVIFFGMSLVHAIVWSLGLNEQRDHAVREIMSVFHLADSSLSVLMSLLELLLPAYAAGQLASLLLRRGLLAGVLGLVLGGLVALWVLLMQAIAASWWWSVLPLADGMLLATWLRMPGWLLERSTPKSWLAPAAAVLVPATALALGVPAYRVYQIPLSEPALAWPARSPDALAAAQECAERYARAADLHLATRSGSPDQKMPNGRLLGLTTEDEAWAKPVADLTIEASRSHASLLLLPAAERMDSAERLKLLTAFLLAFAEQQQKAGKLDEAFDAYLALLQMESHFSQCMRIFPPRAADAGPPPPNHQQTFRAIRNWSAAPGQTVERLAAAIDRLKECHAAFPAPESWLLAAYKNTRLMIDDLPAAARAGIVRSQDITPADWLLSRVPWERARQRRLLNDQTSKQLAGLDRVKKATADDQPIAPAQSFQSLFAVYDEPNATSLTWLSRNPLLWEPVAWQFVCQETDYRATLIALALEAWRAEHGALPGELKQLVDGPLGELPLDPFWAQSFLYYPNGSDALWSIWATARDPGSGSPPLPSMLWSALNQQTYTQSLQPNERSSYLASFPYADPLAPELPIVQIIRKGTTYPIPPAEDENP